MSNKFDFRAGFVRISGEGNIGTFLAAALAILIIATAASGRLQLGASPPDEPVALIERQRE